MRLFVGIDLPDEVKGELHRLTLQLEHSARAGSFVPLDNLHLTLAFIGETERTWEVKQALSQAVTVYRRQPLNAGGTTGFELELLGIGSFKQRKGHTWWVGIGEGPSLERLKTLQRITVQALCDAGFEIEKRSYKPHITLARSVQIKTLVSLEPPPLTAPVQELSLFNSRNINGKQTYSLLESYPL